MLLRQHTRTKLGIENKCLKASRNLAYVEESWAFNDFAIALGWLQDHQSISEGVY